VLMFDNTASISIKDLSASRWMIGYLYRILPARASQGGAPYDSEPSSRAQQE